MFLENTVNGELHTGWIEVISGSMFSGKTEELLRRIKRATIAKQKVKIFKPEIDERYEKDHIVSHDRRAQESITVKNANEILGKTAGAEVVAIDEAQFLDMEIVEVCNTLANKGIRVIVAGLDMDFTGKPFGPMPNLMAVAEYVTKVHAICTRTGNLAHYSFRKSAAETQIVVGEKDIYEPLSRQAFVTLREKK